MAVIKPINGTLSGKIGGQVFFRSHGQQVARELVTPANPRTFAQMNQRVKIANVAAVYRALRSVLNRSFEIKKAHESGYNAFARGALQYAPAMSKQRVAACLGLPMPAQISRGTLVQPEWEEYNGCPALDKYGLAATDTWGAWSAAFLEEYPMFVNGDKIVCVCLKARVNEVAEENTGLADCYNLFGDHLILTIDTTSSTTLEAMGLSIAPNASDAMFPRGFNGSADAQAASDFYAQGMGIFMLRETAGEPIKTSSAYLQLINMYDATSPAAIYNKYRTDAAFEEAAASYGAKEGSALSV